MTQADVLTLVLSIHTGAIPIAVLVARKYGDRSEWLQKSLAGVDALLLRLRQNLGESLRRHLASLPLPPPSASALLVNERGDPHPLPEAPATEGEAFSNAVHDFVRENVITLQSYSTVLSARDSWTGWARVVSWAAFLLVAWQLAAALLVLSSRVLDWGWTTKVLFSTLLPTAVLASVFLLGSFGALINHDRIMDARRAHDPL